MKRLSFLALALGSIFGTAQARTFRVVVLDPVTKLPVSAEICFTALDKSATFSVGTGGATINSDYAPASSVLEVYADSDTTLWLQNQERPIKEITIRITAKKIVKKAPPKAAVTGTSTVRDRDEVKKFVNTSSGDPKEYTKGQAGVADDSAGQQHVRGEHTDLTYVVDGVPLPDTLSGRQGAIVVPSTIQVFEILTGSFAPEFGGQTAAVFNITTLPNTGERKSEANVQYGSYLSKNGDFTTQGPLGKSGSFLLSLSATQTNLSLEPNQPDRQDTYNAGSSRSYFGKAKWNFSPKESLVVTLSHNPDAMQLTNRTGLGPEYAALGQGYGFGGLRAADGTRPDATSSAFGSGQIVLPNQEDAGNRIFQHELSEFATLDWKRKVSSVTDAQLALTILHSGQDVGNNNPAVNLLNLPVDNAIEYNPTVSRNIHHVQLTGSWLSRQRAHTIKAGLLVDAQKGRESYNIVPASGLALNALAALSPSLAPVGTSDSNNLDVNGNPVYTPTSNSTPTLAVNRTGTYRALYLQDTWKPGRWLVNYGLRFDDYRQNQDLGQTSVQSSLLSPRANFSYQPSTKLKLNASYNRIFNTPPLAQGALVGEPLQPEIVDQYDLGASYQISKRSSFTLAYYYKQAKNQVDVGLLIPGSNIGLFSGVNLERGGIHGVEATYQLMAPKEGGFDFYCNTSYSAAKPNGVDNTGAPVGDYNDHDQRITLGAGLAYTFHNGETAALTLQHGSGLASSVVDSAKGRTPRTQLDFRFNTGDTLFHGRGGLSVDIQNILDQRSVINYQSAFSGTRFQIGRRATVSLNFKF